MGINFRSLKKSLSLLVGLAVLSAVSPAQAIVVDGFMDAGYTSSFTATWFNGHENAGSIYDGTDTTEVFYATDATYLYLFVSVPLYAKNMIWGDGASASELDNYDNHWLTHHGGTFSMPYSTAVNSEKLIFDNPDGGSFTFDLKDDNTADVGNSRAYLIANDGTCDTVDCYAATSAMSFELRFLLGDDGDATFAALKAEMQEGLEFHLSPERGLTAVPIPAALPLYASGIALMGFMGWRKKKQKPAIRSI